MSTNFTPELTVTPWEKHLEHLEQACRWAGIQQGRAREYIRLLREFWEEKRRGRQHLLAVYESTEITQVYDLWKHRERDFPGLKENIARTLEKGPLISHDELAGRHGGLSRNTLFVYVMAGHLLRGSVEVLCVDGVPRKGYACRSAADLELCWQEEVVNIECKRPQKRETMSKEAGKGYKQLLNADRGGRPGLVALDCSLFARPVDTFLEKDDAPSAWASLPDKLEWLLGSLRVASGQPAPILAGVLLHASVPAMTRLGASPILSRRKSVPSIPARSHFGLGGYREPGNLSAWPLQGDA